MGIGTALCFGRFFVLTHPGLPCTHQSEHSTLEELWQNTSELGGTALRGMGYAWRTEVIHGWLPLTEPARLDDSEAQRTQQLAHVVFVGLGLCRVLHQLLHVLHAHLLRHSAHSMSDFRVCVLAHPLVLTMHAQPRP